MQILRKIYITAYRECTQPEEPRWGTPRPLGDTQRILGLGSLQLLYFPGYANKQIKEERPSFRGFKFMLSCVRNCRWDLPGG